MSTKQFKIKFGPIVAVIGVVAAIIGLRFAYTHGMLGASTAGSAAVPVVAALPEIASNQDAAAPATSVALAGMPSNQVAASSSPEVRMLVMAWNSQMGLAFANGGPKTTQGSLMQKHGVNLNIIREDDVGKMGSQLINFAKSFKDGNPQPLEGAHFFAVMGDGSAATIAGIVGDLRKLGVTPEVIGSAGYSRGEDKLMGPAAWKQNPKLMRGCLTAGYLRDGDWNISLKLAGDNNIKNNPDEKTWDPDAVNWYSADDFLKAADAYIDGVCEDRPVVHDGKRNGETKHVCVDSVVTWTPGDVNIAQKKGGLVSIVSTKEYRSQMPNTIIGIREWDQANSAKVSQMLAAMFEGGDQVKVYPAALQRAGEASAAIYKEQTGDYWVKYYKGVVETDKQGIQVDLGGSTANNLQDNLALYGLLPGSANVFAATYTVFGNIVKQQYPKLVPDLLPVEKVLNTSYVQAVAASAPKTPAADLPTYKANATITQQVSKRAWSINFDTGKASFTPDTLKQLNELKDGLLVADELAIEIHGHTDNTGDADRNQALSLARAQAVKTWLMQQSTTSFNADRFTKVQGHGSTVQVASNDTETGKAKNRRVEIVLGTTN